MSHNDYLTSISLHYTIWTKLSIALSLDGHIFFVIFCTISRSTLNTSWEGHYSFSRYNLCPAIFSLFFSQIYSSPVRVAATFPTIFLMIITLFTFCVFLQNFDKNIKRSISTLKWMKTVSWFYAYEWFMNSFLFIDWLWK